MIRVYFNVISWINIDFFFERYYFLQEGKQKLHIYRLILSSEDDQQTRGYGAKMDL